MQFGATACDYAQGMARVQQLLLQLNQLNQLLLPLNQLNQLKKKYHN